MNFSARSASVARIMRSPLVVALLVVGCGRTELPAEEIAPAPTPSPVERCSVVVTTSHTGQGTGALARDGNPETGFVSSHRDWQFLQVDFGCAGSFRGLRRMLVGGSMGSTSRGLQGEGVAHSLDGQTWTTLTAATSSGWEGGVAYAPSAWHSLPIGWTPFIRPKSAVTARFVRFNWDGDGDSLREVDIDFAAAP